MAVTEIAGRRYWKKQPAIRRPLLRWSIYSGIFVYLALVTGFPKWVLGIEVLDWAAMEVNWGRVVEGLPRLGRFIGGFLPPDFFTRWDSILKGLLESLWMTAASTVIGVFISIPIALGAARNIAPRPIYYACRSIVAVSRTFHEIILAIFFVKLFGFGPFAGLVTLSFATIGFYAKLLAEDIEDTDRSQLEAVRATGSGWFQWLDFGVLPQVMPRMIGLAAYRFDINFRESTVIGIAGAGGIGHVLNTTFDRYEFDSAAAILLIIIGIVMAWEYFSGYIRRWVQ